MTVQIKSNSALINFSVNRGAALAIRNMMEASHREAQPNTPKRTGTMKDNVLKVVQGTIGTMTWVTPTYPAIQETTQFENYTTPGTGPHFAENATRKIASQSGKFFNEALQQTAQPKGSK